ncbi:MAG: hypothetical protein PHS32_03970 [Rhodoferax sp.]|uniref:hypothetical protein n=1 Tax=Rhodoferax sp. TaxID=50421 RepID=UPI002625B72F|nr:hypothetical protein [Rhodoferax sp.]MDD5332881.1 hypothetical protein [Rhodoferax sp.]
MTLALAAALTLVANSSALAQSSPARGNLQSTNNVPLADYLGLLQQIAPAAEEGAKAYLAAFYQRCGRTLSTVELRRAMTQGEGDPVLMGLIRASHLKDSATRDQWVQQLRCPDKGTR